MTETSGRVTLDIDTTMMEPTEVRIIESHLRAIQAVVDGAQPQGSPDPVPEWRRLVDEVDLSDVNPLSAVLYDLHWLAGRNATITETEAGERRDRESLARIVAVCEQQVGGGWRADPYRRNIPHPDTVENMLAVFVANFDRDEDRQHTVGKVAWKSLGWWAVSWLATLTGDAA